MRMRRSGTPVPTNRLDYLCYMPTCRSESPCSTAHLSSPQLRGDGVCFSLEPHPFYFHRPRLVLGQTPLVLHGSRSPIRRRSSAASLLPCFALVLSTPRPDAADTHARHCAHPFSLAIGCSDRLTWCAALHAASINLHLDLAPCTVHIAPTGCSHLCCAPPQDRASSLVLLLPVWY
jgi:hypothetical protein